MNQKVDLSTDPEAREYAIALGYVFFGWFGSVSAEAVRVDAVGARRNGPSH